VPFLVLDYAPKDGAPALSRGTCWRATWSRTQSRWRKRCNMRTTSGVHRDVKPENLLLGATMSLAERFGVALMSLSMRASRELDIAGRDLYGPNRSRSCPDRPAISSLAVVVYEG